MPRVCIAPFTIIVTHKKFESCHCQDGSSQAPKNKDADRGSLLAPQHAPALHAPDSPQGLERSYMGPTARRGQVDRVFGPPKNGRVDDAGPGKVSGAQGWAAPHEPRALSRRDGPFKTQGSETDRPKVQRDDPGRQALLVPTRLPRLLREALPERRGSQAGP